MKKTYPLQVEGRHPDRVLEAIKHDVRKYLKRERRRPLAKGVDFLDFDCRFGLTPETAQPVHLSALSGAMDSAAQGGAVAFYVELLSKPGHRRARPVEAEGAAGADVPDAAASGGGEGAGSGDGGGGD